MGHALLRIVKGIVHLFRYECGTGKGGCEAGFGEEGTYHGAHCKCYAAINPSRGCTPQDQDISACPALTASHVVLLVLKLVVEQAVFGQPLTGEIL